MTRLGVAMGCALIIVSAACTSTTGDELLVSAAASLTDAFAAMELAFEEMYPDVDVVLNFAGSSTLRDQILEGAPVDVFAAADSETMAAVVAAALTRGDGQVFARNRMQLVVPAGNPGGVDGLDDLAEPSLLVGLCTGSVPCGSFARDVLDRAGVTASVDTEEPDVRALLTKVESGELDVAIVYATDALAAADRVDSVEIPASFNIDASYPIVVLEGAHEMAGVFVDFVVSEAGRSILSEHGFTQ